jgi:iron-sulfur cluster assembly accessory protein
MIQITGRAAQHIRKMLAARSRGETALRLGVKAGGCSGFEYTFGWEAAPRPSDLVLEAPDGGKVFIDPRSLRLLDGSVLDYDTSLLSRGFVITNPHVTSTCGCGVSFSVDGTPTKDAVSPAEAGLHTSDAVSPPEAGLHTSSDPTHTSPSQDEAGIHTPQRSEP